MTTPNLSLQTMASNVLQPSVPFNDALQVLDALVPGVAEAVTATPPTTVLADAGKIWLIDAAPTGAWTGKAGQVALCTGADAWRFIEAADGWRFDVAGADYRLTTGVWTEVAGGGGGPVDAAGVAYDPDVSGLTADDVQAAIDELAADIAAIPGGGGGGGIESIIAGTNITVDNTDPANPVVSATGGGGGGGGGGGYAINFPLVILPTTMGAANYIGDDHSSAALQSASLASNRLIYFPFVAPRDVTLANFGVNNRVSKSGHKARVGIYANVEVGSTSAPGALLHSSGDLDISVVGGVTSSAGFTLTGGTLYWAAVLASTDANMLGSGSPSTYMGREWIESHAANSYVSENVSGGWSALPATAAPNAVYSQSGRPCIYFTV